MDCRISTILPILLILDFLVDERRMNVGVIPGL